MVFHNNAILQKLKGLKASGIYERMSSILMQLSLSLVVACLDERLFLRLQLVFYLSEGSFEVPIYAK
jgi:hypothetical protein